MIFIGVGLAARGLFSEGSDYQDAVLAQTGRRTTALDMKPFALNTERGRRHPANFFWPSNSASSWPTTTPA